MVARRTGSRQGPRGIVGELLGPRGMTKTVCCFDFEMYFQIILLGSEGTGRSHSSILK